VSGHLQGDGLFGLAVEDLSPGIGDIPESVHSLNAAVQATGHPPVAQQAQVAANGLGSDLKMTREILHSDKILLADHIGNLRLALGKRHRLCMNDGKFNG
jgi:hypothetical protein